MAPAYKLTYFDGAALGESIRFLFSYGGIEFHDERISFEKWPSLKTTTPFGQLPILEHNGKILNQSIAITRYVAKQVKLVGKDDWEDAEIDAAVDTVNDIRGRLAAVHYESDEAVKAAKKPNIINEVLPYYLDKLDAQVKRNNGFLAINRLTWADLYFVAALDYLNKLAEKEILTGYSNLEALKKKVLELPAIKAWVEKRPKTAF